MTLTHLQLYRFTAFERLELDLSPGINVFIGTNGTGKTHLMKAAYAACDITKSKLDFADKLIRVFLPSGGNLGRLVKRQKASSVLFIEIKDPPRHSLAHKETEKFILQFRSGNLDQELYYKYRDTFIYEWASGNNEEEGVRE